MHSLDNTGLTEQNHYNTRPMVMLPLKSICISGLILSKHPAKCHNTHFMHKLQWHLVGEHEATDTYRPKW